MTTVPRCGALAAGGVDGAGVAGEPYAAGSEQQVVSRTEYGLLHEGIPGLSKTWR